MIYQLGDRQPVIDPSCFIAEDATIVGSVVIERHASVWFHVTVRGDTDRITVGESSNIQDGSVLHTDDGIQLEVGARVTVGHRAMLHGCKIGEGSLIGIGATILNHAVIGKHCLIGAHSLITEGKVIPDRSLVVGSPGRVIKSITDEMVEQLEAAARHYVDNGRRFRRDLVPMQRQF
jgi:carbonic anhydrase/acetyltransferase-like protein (isoleucine patch superfamily)